MNHRIRQHHFRPKPLNDNLSKGVFNLFLQRLDEGKRFFHQSDILEFKKDEYYLDDAISSGNCDFIDKYITTLQLRVEASKSYLTTLQDEVFDYSGKDTLYFKSNPDFDYYKDDTAFKILEQTHALLHS